MLYNDVVKWLDDHKYLFHITGSFALDYDKEDSDIDIVVFVPRNRLFDEDSLADAVDGYVFIGGSVTHDGDYSTCLYLERNDGTDRKINLILIHREMDMYNAWSTAILMSALWELEDKPSRVEMFQYWKEKALDSIQR